MKENLCNGMKKINKKKVSYDNKNKRINYYWDKITGTLEKYCTQNNISYDKAKDALYNLLYPLSSQIMYNKCFSDGKNLYYFDTSNVNYYFVKISAKELFKTYQIPYIQSEDTDNIYMYLCRDVKCIYSMFVENAKALLQAGNHEPLGFLLCYSLFKYYLSCHQNFSFPIPHILSHPNGFFYVENDNLLYFNRQYQHFIAFTQETLYNYFIFNNWYIPYSKKTLKDIFKYIKLMVQHNQIPLLPEQSCVMQLKTNDSRRYKYIYNNKTKKMQLYYLTNPIRSNNYVPLHTKHTATLTQNLIDYLSKLVCNDRSSFVTLAKLAAAQYSSNQPSKKIIFVEVTANETNNLNLFLSTFCQTIIHHHSLIELCETKKMFYLPIHDNFDDYIDPKPTVFFISEKQLSKLTKHKLSIIKTMINGNTLYYKDAIFGTLHIKNYIPIIYLSRNLDDYVFLKKHFDCSILKINPEIIDIPHFTANETEWFYRIFLPYGREILSNGHNNILRYQPKQKSIPISSIECFINNFTMYSDNNHIYPEELYASYKQFSEHGNPNGQICKKAVFIKLVRSLKAYNYTRIHIRQTKEHDASNRYGFKNLTINTERLNQYLSNTGDASIEPKDLRNELEAITEHYKDLFDTAIPEPPA